MFNYSIKYGNYIAAETLLLGNQFSNTSHVYMLDMYIVELSVQARTVEDILDPHYMCNGQTPKMRQMNQILLLLNRHSF